MEEDEGDEGDLAGKAEMESWKRCLWDGWLTFVTACTDESGSFCLGCLARMGDEGGGLIGDTRWERDVMDEWCMHGCRCQCLQQGKEWRLYCAMN